jgi:hypothetical protein
MGFFSGIKKAFKKIVKGVKKVIKGVVKGVKKVAKKIGSSKILKALAIAAAVVVTGGAAIGAFGGSLASSSFGSWMVGASKAMTGFTIGGKAAGAATAFGTTATATVPGLGGLTAGVTGGLKVGSLLKPFSYAGNLLGSTAGKLTDVTGFTTETARAQNMSEAAWAQKASETASVNLATGEKTTVGELMEQRAKEAGNKELSPWKDRFVNAALHTGSQVAAGYAQAKLLEGDPRGTAMGLANEGKEYQDALQIYTADNRINLGDIYSQLSYGTADPAYQVNSQLYSQQTFQPVA